MAARVEQGMSAPPEVVFSTATDPDRAAAWLPEPLRVDGDQRPEILPDGLRARWSSATHPDWSAEIQVEPADAGGARVGLDLVGGPVEPDGDGALADQALVNLAREVAENLTAG